MLRHKLAVHRNRITRPVGRFKRNVRENLFHDGIKPACPYVFGLGVGLFRAGGNFAQPVIGEGHAHVLGGKQGCILPGKRVMRLGQYAVKFFTPKGRKLDPQRKTPL